eukprot:TRINITY_DN25330_c0_g1_i1.p1 TRINITY_DN25330_c0_g1~~TRINITY_DN25330_c0_g1_i1.p1  ORF type:complete len:205 (-),score=49.06 TRINITY_DN25330_c0_g1_i1:46-660(-)
MAEIAKFWVTLNKSWETLDNLCNDCQTKDVLVIKSIGDIMESLASLFDVFSLKEKSNNIKKQGDILKKVVLTSRNMADVAKFLVTLNKSLYTFKTIRSNSMNKEVGVFKNVGDIMASLTPFFFDVQIGEKKFNHIKTQGDFLKKILVPLTAFHDIDELLIDSGIYGAYGNIALTLDDLAEIVHSVGIEALSKELGLNLDFINDI